MRNLLLIYISRLLLLLLPFGQILWSAHLVLEEHANSFEVNDLKFEKVSSPHWCSDFLHGENRGLLPNITPEEEFFSIAVKKRTYLDVSSYIKTLNYLRFYVRGPPVCSI
ncbi:MULTISPECIES: hypothetical protein [unclassified Zunongwangia]|uniref:hypothetical protein n=1 Tax=unclassified Zunongwangia TaxID=2632541 RepID=UPI0022DD0E7B|nr:MULTISPECIES: hypothetical protein [unclassified Zunongwangia]WBL23310.1 hypothetical protein PBT89_04995 [Zunongwangia sp. HRR-M8]WBL24746.1 hypothetical protein PBT91_12595 [Zunongwangia sp. HGR-M22]